MALLLLLAAVWIGLVFADTLVRPLARADHGRRAGARRRSVVRGSRAATATDELGSLSRAFNRMTSQLESQRRELIEANRQLDQRRRFTETVLSGVSAGVIGLDQDGRIDLPNRSATELLGRRSTSWSASPLEAAVPEMADLLDERPQPPGPGGRGPGQDPPPAASCAPCWSASPRSGWTARSSGFVVTFDDITELLSAQRKAAWADVARRIAHEIKNPLTPIQLSAERLKRKYLKQITDDPETFITCTDTIVRQVGDIGRMVDEFSAFARMPPPVMKPEDLSETCQQALFLQRNAHAEDRLRPSASPTTAGLVPLRSRQCRQAVTNLLQNAADAIDGRLDDGRATCRKAQVRMRPGLRRWRGLRSRVEDNGKGLPTDDRDRLTEPYVTTRTKGTGLGLAIVKKIMEDHGGRLVARGPRRAAAPG